MSGDSQSPETVFERALEIETPAERATFLDRACGGNDELRRQIGALVEDHFAAGGFLQRPAVEFAATVDEPPDLAAGAVIGRYKLLQEIGQGGFGVVFMAEQVEPVRRRVALKIIKLGMDTKQVIGRFEAERQALAMMDHPNIAKVHDAGTTETGRPYFVMELVRGMPITEFCDEGKLTTRERLALFIDVCHAVQHAHQKGVIHRDIKPTNVLVTLHDDRPVPKVIDFGIAKATQHRLTERTVFTEFKQFIGSPMYMSPEQAALSGLDVDTRTDVYSLGVLLYELLTGGTPYDKERLQKAAYDEICRIIREEEPPRPSTKVTTLGKDATTLSARRRVNPANLRQQLQGELDWIVMKALEKDRARRYESAGGFARDVQRFLDDEPVEARPASATYRLRKFAARNKSAITAATLVAAVLVLGTIVSSWQAIRATSAARDAAEKQSRAVESEKDATQARADAELALEASRLAQAELALEKGQLLGEQGDVNSALLWMARALRTAPADAVDLRRAILVNLSAWSRATFPLKFVLPHEGRVTVAAFTQGGSVLITAERIRNEGFAVQRWNTMTGSLIAPSLRRMSGMVTAMSLDATASRLALGYVDGHVELADVSTGVVEKLASATQPGPITALAFSPRENLLLVARSLQPIEATETLDENSSQISSSGQVQLVDLSMGTTRLAQALKHKQSVWVAGFSPDGGTFVTQSGEWAGGDRESTLHFWSTSGEELRDPLLLPISALTVAVSPSGNELLTGHWDYRARLWSMKEETVTRIGMMPCVGPVRAVAFHPQNADLILLSDFGGTARLWNVATNQQVGPTLWQQFLVRCAGFSADGRYAFCGTRESIKLWELTTFSPGQASVAYRPDLFPAAISQKARSILEQDGEAFVQVRNALTGEAVSGSIRHDDRLLGGAFDLNSELAVTIDAKRMARIWNLKSGELVHALDYPEPAYSAAISPDGTTVVIGYFGDTAVFWNVESGRQEGNVIRHQMNSGPVFSLQYSRDGTRLLTGGADGTARLWDATTREQIAEFQQLSAAFVAEFSPDESKILTCGGGEGARIWDVASESPMGVPFRHEGPIHAANFSPDGQVILTGGIDGTARLWDVATGRQLGPAMQHDAFVSRVGFWPDGRTIVTGKSTAGFGVGSDYVCPAHYWPAPRPLMGSDEQIELWIQTITGMELDESGGVIPLDPETWQVRHETLMRIGAPQVLDDVSQDVR